MKRGYLVSYLIYKDDQIWFHGSHIMQCPEGEIGIKYIWEKLSSHLQFNIPSGYMYEITEIKLWREYK